MSRSASLALTKRRRGYERHQGVHPRASSWTRTRSTRSSNSRRWTCSPAAGHPRKARARAIAAKSPASLRNRPSCCSSRARPMRASTAPRRRNTLIKAIQLDSSNIDAYETLAQLYLGHHRDRPGARAVHPRCPAQQPAADAPRAPWSAFCSRRRAIRLEAEKWYREALKVNFRAATAANKPSRGCTGSAAKISGQSARAGADGALRAADAARRH